MIAQKRQPSLRYRCPSDEGPPPIGCILLGEGLRVRRGYRVLAVGRVRTSVLVVGQITWKLLVEPLSLATARAEVDAGAPRWSIYWDRRKRRDRHGLGTKPADAPEILAIGV